MNEMRKLMESVAPLFEHNFKKNDLLRIKDEWFDDFMETTYEESRDYFRRTNKWIFRYVDDNGHLVVEHAEGDDTEYWLKPEWVEPVDGEAGETWDHEEARMPRPMREVASADEKETLMNKLHDIADEVEKMIQIRNYISKNKPSVNKESVELDESVKKVDNLSQLPKGVEKPLVSMDKVRKEVKMRGMEITHISYNKSGKVIGVSAKADNGTVFTYVNNKGVNESVELDDEESDAPDAAERNRDRKLAETDSAEAHSPTLVRIDAEGRADRKRAPYGVARTLVPNEEYPLPWEVVIGDRYYGICEVRAANSNIVISELNYNNAEAIVNEINADLPEKTRAWATRAGNTPLLPRDPYTYLGDDIDYMTDDDEESDEEFESGDIVRFTDEYAEPDFPDEVYTLRDWDPVKGRGWAVDEYGQGWSVQSFQIQHAYVDEAAPLAVAAGGAAARMATKKGAGKMVSKAAGGATTRATDSGIKSASKWAKDKLNQMASDADDIDESLAEGDCGCDAPEMPAQTDTSINYSKTHTQDDASVTVSANAKNLEQLQDMLRLAGVDADLAQAHIAEPEPEIVAEPEPAVSFGTRGDYSYSTDADFIRDQLMQRMKGFM